MPVRLARRSILLMPLLLAACAEETPPQTSFAPPDYSYLPPLRLNVAKIDVENRFVPSDLPPSVYPFAPVPPVLALRRMAEDRLKALGPTGRAVFVIKNASLIEDGETISGRFSVELEIFSAPDTRAGFADASVSRQRVGEVKDLPATLYDLTKEIMRQMNVEFEYEIRRSLSAWLLGPGAVAAPVQAAPLAAPGSTTAPAAPAPAANPTQIPSAPPAKN